MFGASAASVGAGAVDGFETLTLPVWVEYGGGTGAIASPNTLCDTSRTGSELARLSDPVGSFSDPAWSRDGTRLAFAQYDRASGRHSIRVTAARSWKPVTLGLSSGALSGPAWSPDGSTIAYASSSAKAPGIYTIRPDGRGNARFFAGSAFAPTWSPGGDRVAFATPAGIDVARVDGAAAEQVTAGGATPAWSPDGSRIAFVANVSAFGDQDLFFMAPDGSGRVRLTMLAASGGVTTIGRPAWSLDGSTIAVRRTVTHSFGKGDFVQRDLILVDVASGSSASLKLPLAFGDPAWRPAPPAPANPVARPCAVLGGNGGTALRGTPYDDLIVAGDGNDSIDGGAGNDWIEAGLGDDRVVGGAGRDEIWSGPGTDRDLVRDGERDLVHCGDFPRDTVLADRLDNVAGRCKRTLVR